MSTETPVPAELALAPDAALVGRACVVLLGGRPFAVDVTDAREVVVLETTTPVPGAPAAVIGNAREAPLLVLQVRPPSLERA